MRTIIAAAALAVMLAGGGGRDASRLRKGNLMPIFGFTIVVLTLAAWGQHLYTCFTNEQWGFLVAGAIFVPVAVVHGIGIWLGVWG